MQRRPLERYEGKNYKGIEGTANKGLYNLYCSPDYVKVINLKSLRQMERLVCTGEINCYNALIEKSQLKCG